MTNLETIYTQAKAAWTPQEGDNLENAWFYSSWAGFIAMCTELQEDPWKHNHIAHQAICSSRGEWAELLRCFANLYPAYPPEPKRHFSSDCEPYRNESLAGQIFARQFRRAFPGKRINSRFAKEKWREVRSQAEVLAEREYQSCLAEWQEREDRRNREYDRQIAEWQEKCGKVAEAITFLDRIIGRERSIK